MRYVVALDQGTTSSRAVLFDETGRMVISRAVEFPQIFPKPGWVEHDPEDIYSSQVDALRQALAEAGVEARDIACVGIANQRETTLLWERATGKPVYNAIVWQCRRSAPLVEKLRSDGLEEEIRQRTGLLPDAYFSGTKLQWLFEYQPELLERARRGELCFGTVDSYLLYRFTHGAAHKTDATNAGRTMLFNIRTQEWDDELLSAMGIPREVLPEVCDTACEFGVMDEEVLGVPVPILAMAGDQHAALYGQGCWSAGSVKNTYGTGCFLLMNTGSYPVTSQNGLLTTLAWRIGGKASYALEGSVFIAGAVIKWLRDEMGLISTAAESEEVATSILDNEGVYMVPAFTGLGAPYWDMYGRGVIVGLTRGTGRRHIVRAALESIAYQTLDVMQAMTRDSGVRPASLRADGGASANGFLMQFQADMLGCQVARPAVVESTAMGAAMLAGREAGLYSEQVLKSMLVGGATYTPQLSSARRQALLEGWKKAVERARGWAAE